MKKILSIFCITLMMIMPAGTVFAKNSAYSTNQDSSHVEKKNKSSHKKSTAKKKHNTAKKSTSAHTKKSAKYKKNAQA